MGAAPLEAKPVIEEQAMGGRRVGLFIPFNYAGQKIDAITIQPWLLDHTLNWHAGQFATILVALSQMSGLSEPILRQLRYPDAERVMTTFLQMMPSDIREAVGRGEFPTPAYNQEAGAPAGAELEARVVAPFDSNNPFANLQERPAYEPPIDPAILTPHRPEDDDRPAVEGDMDLG